MFILHREKIFILNRLKMFIFHKHQFEIPLIKKY